MPKVGQWGQLSLGVVYYKTITSKVEKTTPNQRLQLYKRVTNVTMFTQFTTRYKDTQM